MKTAEQFADEMWIVGNGVHSVYKKQAPAFVSKRDKEIFNSAIDEALKQFDLWTGQTVYQEIKALKKPTA